MHNSHSKKNDEPDWALWRSFAAVAEHGSLSAAGRAIGLSQPTLGRHVEALEQALGMVLFERRLSGLSPTEAALRLLEPIRRAGLEIDAALLAASGGRTGLSGTVRVTASTVCANYILPPMLARIRADLPGIALELVPSDTLENLLRRESDIAVRMVRPTQTGLITRKLGQSPILACAHINYLDRAGTPRNVDELLAHDLIGFDRSDLIIRTARAGGFDLDRDDFALRTDSQTLIWELIRAGAGIGFAQKRLIAEAEGVVPLDLDLGIPPLEAWLTTHRELYLSPRIRAVHARLSRLLSAYFSGQQEGS